MKTIRLILMLVLAVSMTGCRDLTNDDLGVICLWGIVFTGATFIAVYFIGKNAGLSSRTKEIEDIKNEAVVRGFAVWKTDLHPQKDSTPRVSLEFEWKTPQPPRTD